MLMATELNFPFFSPCACRRDVVRGGFGEEEGGGDWGHHGVRGAGERLQGDEVRGAVGGTPAAAAATSPSTSSKPRIGGWLCM